MRLSHACDADLQFLRRKWARELDYRLRKYLWAFKDNRISVCFEYEYHDARWGGPPLFMELKPGLAHMTYCHAAHADTHSAGCIMDLVGNTPWHTCRRGVEVVRDMHCTMHGQEGVGSVKLK